MKQIAQKNPDILDLVTNELKKMVKTTAEQ